jgi:photosystem II stability/assembly factor-like uncharacterized protein
MNTLIRIICLTIFLTKLLLGQWVQQQTNLPVWTYPVSIDAIDENVCWAVAAKHPGTEPYLGFIKTINGGENWICDTIHTTEGMFNTICALDGNTAYVSIKNTNIPGRIFKTIDGGNNWVEQNALFTVLNDAPRFIHFFDADNGVAIGVKQANYFEIFTTSDAGDNWNKVTEALMPVLSSDEDIFCDNYTSAGSSIWFLSSASRIFKSSNKGLSWIALDSPQSFSGGNPNIAFEDESTGLLLADVNKPWRTINGGVDWEALPYNEDFSLRYICYVPGSSASYMLFSVYGSMYTMDCGNTYSIVDSSAHLNIDFSTPAAGWANGISFGVILKWAGQPLPVKDNQKPVSIFMLEQNFPNPFNPSTKIKYSIPQSSNVELKVFDILSNEIETLINEEKSVGTYEINWNAEGLPSGVYFYQIKAGDYIKTKKMVLLK